MTRKAIFLPAVFIILSAMLSACIGLIPLEEDETGGSFGPSYSPSEHQMRVFDAIWTHLEETYIHYESADVDWDALNKEYIERINVGLSDKEFTALIQELETDLPTGTLAYQSRAERIEAETTDTSTYEGIGAVMNFAEDPAPHFIVLSVMPGSPAENAGLKAHDSVSKIDGEAVQIEEGQRAVNRIRGAAGSTVTLTVQRPGESERSIEIQRTRLTSTGKIEARMLAGTNNYGYILFPPTGSATLVKDVVASLQTFTTNRTLDGLVLDLRIASSASGGWPMEELFKLFHDGNVGEFYNTEQEQVLNINGEDQFSSQTVPLVILVGESTSGAPEILAAGLQSGGRAQIVGTTTLGAIEITTPFYLPNGALILVESTSFRLLNGEEVGNTGVQPDLEVEAGWDEVIPDADPVLEAAIELLDAQK
ncbi:MAG TPA: S41 family peptidase [Anaerolineales bacterium]|nr:S41 family peptidase [Anaerolineales bacterium]